MSLDIAGLVRTGLNLAIDLTPDVQGTVSYHRRLGSSYDPVTGAVTAEDLIATGITAIITKYTEDEEDEKTRKLGRELVVIDFASLAPFGITNADVNDLILEDDGPEREVISFDIDPTRQVLKLVTVRCDAVQTGQPIHGEGDEPIEGEGGPIYGIG